MVLVLIPLRLTYAFELLPNSYLLLLPVYTTERWETAAGKISYLIAQGDRKKEPVTEGGKWGSLSVHLCCASSAGGGGRSERGRAPLSFNPCAVASTGGRARLPTGGTRHAFDGCRRLRRRPSPSPSPLFLCSRKRDAGSSFPVGRRILLSNYTERMATFIHERGRVLPIDETSFYLEQSQGKIIRHAIRPQTQTSPIEAAKKRTETRKEGQCIRSVGRNEKMECKAGEGRGFPR